MVNIGRQVGRYPFWILLVLVAFIVMPVQADQPAGIRARVATDDPAGEPPLIGLDGAGNALVQRFLGGQAPAHRADRRARNISLVGALQLTPFNLGVHADVAGYRTESGRNLAFVGKWRGACPGTGVDIIDISNPAAPVKIADTTDYPDTSMEDMKAMRIGTRDVLAIGLQDCGNIPDVGTTGLELVDITDPANPQTLSVFPTGAGGVHELDVTRTPGGRTLALLAVPNLEALTATPPNFANGVGDLLIVDISDPANPVLVGEWGVLGEPALGLEFYLNVRRGGDARTLLHSARANTNGTRAYLSYWDAGVIILDISDPTNPVFLGRTAFGDTEEGNAHSIALARGGNVLVQADEDFSPFELIFRITAPASIANGYPAAEGLFTKPIVELPGRTMSGEVVHVGRGCPPGTPGLPGGDPYLINPTGKIALIERGVCRFDNKIAWAQLNGAVGAIVYNNVAGMVLMGGDNPVALGSPSVIGTLITIPGISVERTTGLAMVGALGAGQVVSVDATALFNGWGFLRIFDASNPMNPIEIGTYATPNTNNDAVATLGTWSVHNPEVRGNTVYASWYSDGVQVIDISQRSAPRSIGFWTGAGAPVNAPPVNIWSVVPHGELMLVSDRNFGLYVLKHVPRP